MDEKGKVLTSWLGEARPGSSEVAHTHESRGSGIHRKQKKTVDSSPEILDALTHDALDKLGRVTTARQGSSRHFEKVRASLILSSTLQFQFPKCGSLFHPS